MYLGIENGVILSLKKSSDKYVTNIVELLVIVDGIPPHKSSSKEFWPIQCSVFNLDSDPFLAALYYGKEKPASVQEFLEDFVKELQHLQTNGIKLDDKALKVKVKAFVCDEPAMAFLESIKGQTAFTACERCEIIGCKKEGHMVLVSNQPADARTDEKFANFNYKDHQYGPSPLLECHIPCVTSFSLDYMHLICLGVTRQMLYFLTCGPKLYALSQHQINTISEHLVTFAGKMPS